MIELGMVVGVLYGLPLRGVRGFLAMLASLQGLAVTVPHHSTLCRRRRTVSHSWAERVRSRDCVLVVDATGVSVTSTGEWLRLRHRDSRRSTFVKLHVGIEHDTGRVLALQVTDAAGSGTGDVSQGPALISQACADRRLTAVLADRAYDAQSCYRAAEQAGGRLLCEPKSTATRGLHPHRDEHLTQIGRIGPPAWKVRVGYGQRAQVESWFSGWKRTLGEHTRATSTAGRRAEVVCRVHVYDQLLGWSDSLDE